MTKVSGIFFLEISYKLSNGPLNHRKLATTNTGNKRKQKGWVDLPLDLKLLDKCEFLLLASGQVKELLN